MSAAMDAAAIFTFKLVRSAGSGGCESRQHNGMKPARWSPVKTWARTGKLLTAVDLVTAILAVRISVTPPFFVNALARAALDLAGRTFHMYHWLAATLFKRLIRLVRTVCIIITHPAEGDAGRGAALEFVGAAGWWCTVQLIAAIITVILAIAHKVPGDTAATGASELISTTCYVAC